jgi:mono/diheme cytochrome c family protein
VFRFVARNAQLGALLVICFALSCLAGPTPQKQSQANNLVEAREWFRAYCASCHGIDGKGDGPAAPALKQRPADLTMLAKRNNGRFPTDYVKKVLVHGVSMPAHGSGEMPIWGPTFAGINQDKLIEYLESVQTK